MCLKVIEDMLIVFFRLLMLTSIGHWLWRIKRDGKCNQKIFLIPLYKYVWSSRFVQKVSWDGCGRVITGSVTREIYKTQITWFLALIKPATNVFEVESCIQLYLPCFKALGQFERIWWTVGAQFPHKGQLESTQCLQRLRLRGVCDVSIPTSRRKDSWPAGRPVVMHFYTWFFSSSIITSRNLPAYTVVKSWHHIFLPWYLSLPYNTGNPRSC